MTPDAKLGKILFDEWRVEITGDTWPQIGEVERAAWTRIARLVLDTAGDVVLSLWHVELPQHQLSRR